MRSPLSALFAANRLFSLWRRRRFSDAGTVALVFLAATAILSLGERRSRVDLLCLFDAALLATTLPTVLWFPQETRRLTVERVLPRFAGVGAPFVYRLIVRNGGRRATPPLRILDRVVDRFPDAAESETERRRRQKGDWTFGYSWWRRRVAYNRGLNVEEALIPALAAGGERALRMQATPLRRGVIRFDAVEIAGVDPLGLIYGSTRRASPQTLMVLPRRHPMRPLILAGSRRLQPGGVAMAQSVGNADEFHFLREFRSGDSRRHIHWRSSARRGEFVVKENQEEHHQRHALIVDTFALIGEDDLFESALEVAASVIGAAHLGEALLDMMFVGDKACRVTVGRGVGAVENLLEVLACASPSHDRPFSQLSDLVLGHAATLSGGLCVLLRWDEPRRALVQTLRTLGAPLEVVVVTEAEASISAFDVPVGLQGCFHLAPVGRIASALAALGEERGA